MNSTFILENTLNNDINKHSLQKQYANKDKSITIGSPVDFKNNYTTQSLNRKNFDKHNYQYDTLNTTSFYISNQNISSTNLWEKDTVNFDKQFELSSTEQDLIHTLLNKWWYFIIKPENEIIKTSITMNYDKGVYTPKQQIKSTGIIKKKTSGTMFSTLGLLIFQDSLNSIKRLNNVNTKWSGLFTINSLSTLKVLNVKFTHLGEWKDKWQGLINGIDTLLTNSPMEIVKVNMINSTSTLALINNWLKNRTNNICTTLIDKLTTIKQTIYLNLVIHKLKWDSAFNSDQTRVDLFYKNVNVSQHVYYMTQENTFNVYKDLLEIKLAGPNNLMFGIYKNNTKNIPTIKQVLINNIKNTRLQKTRIFIPRFRIEESNILEETNESIIIQKVIMDISENGTKLNGSYNTFTENLCDTTTVFSNNTRDNVYGFKVNSPFYYYIRKNNSILLIGYFDGPKNNYVS
jgi:hypothetical protein